MARAQGNSASGRIDNLARLLSSEDKPSELLTLKCLGYYDDVNSARYGFVFSYPEESDSKMVSLKELMDNPSPKTLPTLEDRYQVAYSLGLSLATLHASGWLHKSIRSHNVLFPLRVGKVDWARPYLVGFEFSRPDRPDESSEKPEQSVRFSLYRHPLTQGSPTESFRQVFDVYSAAVILTEVGLWRSAWKMWKDNMSLAEFHRALQRRASEMLAHSMGKQYRDSIVKCLRGELEDRDSSVLRAFYIDVVEVLGRHLKAT